MPILELLVPGVKPLRSKGAVFKCGKMFPIVPRLLICLFRVNYFANSHSQIDNQLLFNYFAKSHSQIKE